MPASALRSAPRLLLLALPAVAACSQIVGIQDYSNTDIDAPPSTCNPTTTTVSTDSSPRGIALADFNGDGKLDLVTANGAANSVNLLLGNGDGSFQPRIDIALTSLNTPSAVAVADLNADMKPDVVATNRNGSSATVLLGQGGDPPKFAPPVVYAGAVQPSALALADFDGNTRPDIAMTGFGNNTFGVVLNNGDGTFQADVDHMTCGGPSAIASADFNGDNEPDVAVACSSGNAVALFLNAGAGNFSRLADSPVGNQPSSIIAADVNGDRKVDLLVSNLADNTLTVLLGSGGGAFTAQPPVPTGAMPEALAAGDLDGDGHVDIAVADFGANAVSVLHGNGDGTFQPKIDYPAGMGTVAVAIGKLDGDATPDLAVVDEISSSVTVLRLGACQ